MKNLEMLDQYHFEKSIFNKEVTYIIPDLLDIFDYYNYKGIWKIYDFIMCKDEDNEYYIIHLESGTMINWYKHLGRTNTCNKDLSIDGFREFLKMLKCDIDIVIAKDPIEYQKYVEVYKNKKDIMNDKVSSL